MIDDIEKLISEVPMYFPLQDWSALNPFLDCVHVPFHGLLKELRKNTPIKGYLPLSEYVQFYSEGKININDLHQACLEHHDFGIHINEMIDTQNQEKVIQFDQNSSKKQTMLIASQLFNHGFTDIFDWIETRIQNFLSAWFDQGVAFWKMPTQEKELLLAWKSLTKLENKKWNQLILELPDDPELGCKLLLSQLNIPESCHENYMRQIIWRLIGWMSLIKCKNRFPSQPNMIRCSAMLSPVVIWLMHERYYLTQLNEAQRKAASLIFEFENNPCENQLHQHLIIWQRALEIHEHQYLLSALKKENNLSLMKADSQVQWLFCIDPRSFKLRRFIQEKYQHATLGVAGFFGFIFSAVNEENHVSQWQSPGLLSPNMVLSYSEWISQKKLFSSFFDKESHVLSDVKNEQAAPFFLFEMVGIFFIINWFSQQFLGRSCNKKAENQFKTDIWQSNHLPFGFTMVSAADAAEIFLQQCGLSTHFSKYIVLCGHATHVINHPQRASFECGACGGHGGQLNAVVACKILNNSDIRNELQKRSIYIPETTQFLPAMHETSTDQMYWLEKKEEIPQILRDITQAINSAQLNKENYFNVLSNPYLWSELVPEFGLANHAALIIGGSVCARSSILEGRCFLQTYDASQDDHGEILKGILESVAVVAQNINAQYYFSSTDPAVLGGGNKALQNVVGLIGVMEGNQSDLKIGFSDQSLIWQGRRIHTPIRLLVVIMANKKFVSDVISQTKIFKQLVDNQWLFVEVIP